MQVDAGGCRWMQVDAGGLRWMEAEESSTESCAPCGMQVQEFRPKVISRHAMVLGQERLNIWLFCEFARPTLQ